MLHKFGQLRTEVVILVFNYLLNEVLVKYEFILVYNYQLLETFWKVGKKNVYLTGTYLMGKFWKQLTLERTLLIKCHVGV